MTIVATLSPLHRELASRLEARRDALGALLQRSARAAETVAEVTDFKDAAAEESRAVVDEATLSHAAAELEQVASALRRLRDGSYGECVDCGEPIDERRLAALPATPVCTDCQALREHAVGAHR